MPLLFPGEAGEISRVPKSTTDNLTKVGFPPEGDKKDSARTSSSFCIPASETAYQLRLANSTYPCQ